jgi:outer membrane immunogenic protein
MKKITFALAAATALIAAPALAADLRPMAAKAPPMAAYAPTPMWSGFYIGIHGGYGWGDADYYFPTTTAFGPAGGSFSHDIDGAMVGGHAGFNWQWNQLVLGLEAAGTWTDISGSVVSPFFATDTFSTDINSIFTFTPRLGLAAGNALFYVKGGLAVGDVETRLTSPVIVGGSASSDETRVGWTFGGGIEYAVTPNWIFGIEGNYYDFGSEDLTVPATGVVYENDVTAWSVLGRVSYKFGGAPVVAKY